MEGAQLWVTATNARGGLHGHPIKFVVYDDGGDPARHRAQVQDAIERQHVIAFLANTEQITGQPSVTYVTDKKVPIIGTAGGVDWAYTSAMYFPASSESHAMARTFVLSIASQIPDKHKLGILYCAEASGCQQAADISEKTSKETDYQVVYKGKASIAQPDFTAECLAARNAGAEVFYINMDSNSISRVAASCARQGYKPRYAAMVTTLVDRFKDDKNLDGLVGPTQIFPYFQTGTPASDEYQRALASYGKGLTNGVALAAGWTAGKLLEAAAANLSEPPTNVSVLEGLYALKGADLGGLTLPLTFVRDQPAPARSCWFDIAIASGSWRTPDNYKLHCA